SYLQDVWKASRNLTLNFGVRWEPFFPAPIGRGQGPTLNEGVMYEFDHQKFLQNVKSSVFPNAPAGMFFAGDAGFPLPGPINKKWWTFAPRVGFAWDPKGDGKTSIRSAFGIATDFSGVEVLGGSSSAPPWGFGVTVQSPSGGFENPWSDYPGGNP